MQTITKRYVLGRQGYASITGELEPTFDKPSDPPIHLNDPVEVAETVVEMIVDDPGIIYNIQDLVTQKGVLVSWEEGDTKESVKSDIVAALAQLNAEASQASP